MEFRLKYEGRLKSNGSPAEKHRLREYFHPQLKEFWSHPPYKNVMELLRADHADYITTLVEGFEFCYIVSQDLGLTAELDIVLLKPDPPGRIISSGDVDNRLKTLFDALRFPKNKSELPTSVTPPTDSSPFYCVLEDDNLITSVKVTCDRLLDFQDPLDVFLLIHVKTNQVTKGRWLDLLIP